MNYLDVSPIINKVNGFMGSEAQREFMFNLGKTTELAAEIGSYKGLSAVIVLLGMLSSNRKIPPKYYCIDTFEASNTELTQESTLKEFEKVTNELDKYGIIQIVKGYSTDIATIQQIPSELDWIYIDGDHSTDAVIKDIKTYAPLVKENGLMLFHDYTWETVKKGIEFCEEKKYIQHITDLDDFAIYKVI